MPDAWNRRLATCLAAAVSEAAVELRGVPVVRLAVDCHPWNGLLMLGILTAAEADADATLLDPQEMAAWRRYWYTDELPAWTLVAKLGKEMRPAYEAAAGTTGGHREVAEAFFLACAIAVASPEVSEAVGLFVRDPRFRITVTHPDDGREFYPPSERGMLMTAEEAVRATIAFKQLAVAHPAVEVWPDDGFTEGGYSYYWVVSRDGSSVRNLAYVRCKAGVVELRTYDEQGDDRWGPVE